jgi:agmatinase
MTDQDNAKPKYQPPDAADAPRFSGIRTFMRLPHVRTLEDVDFIVLGIPFDSAVTNRSGARLGPDAIRHSSVWLRPWNPAVDVIIFDYLSGVDYGDVPTVPGYIEDTHERIEAEFEAIARAGVIPFTMGGDHSVTLGELRGLAKVHGPLALVQLDAHLDIAKSYFGRKYNHGTPFRRAVEEGLVDPHKSLQIGIRGSNSSPEKYVNSRKLGYELITMYEVDQIGIETLLERIHSRVGKSACFITIDIDSIDPTFAPGTGTPEIGGFTTREILKLVRGLKGLCFVAADVVEVLPAIDPAELTAYLAANLLYELISLEALKRKENTP